MVFLCALLSAVEFQFNPNAENVLSSLFSFIHSFLLISLSLYASQLLGWGQGKIMVWTKTNSFTMLMLHYIKGCNFVCVCSFCYLYGRTPLLGFKFRLEVMFELRFGMNSSFVRL